MVESLDAPTVCVVSSRPVICSLIAQESRKALPMILVVLIALVPFFPAYDKGASPMDEGSLLLYPELIFQGKVPYRDFETFYGPANCYVLAGIQLLVGPDITAERSVGLLYRALIFSFIFALIARWSTTLAAGGVALAGWVLLGSQIVAYAWFGALACLLGSILLMSESGSNARAFFGGLLGAGALLYRADLGLAVIVCALPLLLMPNARRVRYLKEWAPGCYHSLFSPPPPEFGQSSIIFFFIRLFTVAPRDICRSPLWSHMCSPSSWRICSRLPLTFSRPSAW